MWNLLKNIFSVLNKNKKSLFLISSLISFLFIIRFPWNDLLEKTFRDLQKKSSQVSQIEFEDLQLKMLPPGVQFKNLSFFPKGRPISLDSLIVSVDVAKWLAFKKAWKFKLSKINSHLFVSFYKTEKQNKEKPESPPIDFYSIKSSMPNFNLEVLNDLFPNTQFSGLFNSQFSFNGSPKDVEKIKASLDSIGENIYLSSLKLKTPLGPLNLPPINWSSIKASAEVKESEVIFKGLRLGEAKDDFYVKMKGSGALDFSYTGQPRLRAYNLELQIDLNKNFPLRILDLMFGSFKEDKGDFYRYKLRLIGEGSQVPNMEKLDSFSLNN